MEYGLVTIFDGVVHVGSGVLGRERGLVWPACLVCLRLSGLPVTARNSSLAQKKGGYCRHSQGRNPVEFWLSDLSGLTVIILRT